jgi:four helix bundle protein
MNVKKIRSYGADFFISETWCSYNQLVTPIKDVRMKPNPLRDKSYLLAIQIINLCRDTIQYRKEFIISKQLMRAGTSIGANISEAEYAQSKADFIYKMSIALKEASETEYWLNIYKDTDFIDETNFKYLESQVKEILRMLISTVKTTKIKNPT